MIATSELTNENVLPWPTSFSHLEYGANFFLSSYRNPLQMSSDPSNLNETQPTQEEVLTSEVKPKRVRTPAQVAALEAARQKAMKVRAEKAELNRKEKELARAAVERERRERAAKIQAEYEALSQPTDPLPPPDDPPKRRKPARRIVVHEASSGEEEEDDTVDVVLPPKPKPPPPDPLARARMKMFQYE